MNKKNFYITSFIISVIAVAILVYAYGGTNPAVHGHSVAETDLGPLSIDDSSDEVSITGSLMVNGYNMSPAVTQEIRVNPSMSGAEIQEEIDKIPKYIPYGTSVMFNFTPGTYSLTRGLVFGGFYGGGSLYIVGDTGGHTGGANGVRCNQASFLDFSGYNQAGIQVIDNDIYIYIRDLRIKVKTDVGGYTALSNHRSKYVDTYYSCFMCTSSANGVGLYYQYGTDGAVYFNEFSSCNIAINSLYSSDIFAYYNDDDGVSYPSIGYYANTATIRYGGNQMNVGSQLTVATNGGEINPG